jgi:hypothetical protein
MTIFEQTFRFYKRCLINNLRVIAPSSARQPSNPVANHLWSVSGDSDRKYISNTFVQPLLSYTTPKQTTFGLNTESSYNWKTEEWTVPVNAAISQLVKIDKQPVQFHLGYRNYLDRPDGGPDWGLRFQVTLQFPK